jgi:hypothetical protein
MHSQWKRTRKSSTTCTVTPSALMPSISPHMLVTAASRTTASSALTSGASTFFKQLLK